MIKIAVHKADDNGDIITLLEDLPILCPPKSFTVPANFQSDGCSVPEFLWDSISPQLDPRTLRGAIAHDFLYRITPEGWSRKAADELFYDLIIKDGFPKFKALMAYLGVRLFGSGNWRGKNPDHEN